MKNFIKFIVICFVMSFTVSSCFAANADAATQAIVPRKVSRLVKSDKNIPLANSDSMKEILGLFWAEPNGKLILNTLCKHNVKIKLVNSNQRACAVEEEVSVAYSPFIAIQGDTAKIYYITVSIPVNYLNDYANKNLSEDKRLYSLGYILHELAHAYVYVKDSRNVNSIEQKLDLTMLGYNESSKILTGNYLSKSDSVFYTEKALKSIVDYETKVFPVYSGTTKKLLKWGITLQNAQDYSNIVAIYNKLLAEGKIKPCASFLPKKK